MGEHANQESAAQRGPETVGHALGLYYSGGTPPHCCSLIGTLSVRKHRRFRLSELEVSYFQFSGKASYTALRAFGAQGKLQHPTHQENEATNPVVQTNQKEPQDHF